MAPTSQQIKANKAKINAGGKAQKARVQRYLKSQDGKPKEGAKSTLLLKGSKCSQGMGVLLKDLRSIQAPHSKLLTKKNQIFAFDTEGELSLEFLCTKNDCMLFSMGSHNKKRPNNLVVGRTFDHHILDLAELGILRYKSISDYGGSIPKKRIGSKPLMLFNGDLWEQNDNHTRLQSLLVDFYRGDPVEKLAVQGLDHIIVFTMAQNSDFATPVVHQRTYFCKLKKNPNGSNTPSPHLIPCGPDIDFVVRRERFASSDLWRAATKQPTTKKKKVKNHSTNIFGETIGRLHLEKQQIDKLQGRKSKALRRAEKLEKEEERNALEAELKAESEGMGKEFERDFGFQQD